MKLTPATRHGRVASTTPRWARSRHASKTVTARTATVRRSTATSPGSAGSSSRHRPVRRTGGACRDTAFSMTILDHGTKSSRAASTRKAC